MAWQDEFVRQVSRLGLPFRVERTDRAPVPVEEDLLPQARQFEALRNVVTEDEVHPDHACELSVQHQEAASFARRERAELFLEGEPMHLQGDALVAGRLRDRRSGEYGRARQEDHRCMPPSRRPSP